MPGFFMYIVFKYNSTMDFWIQMTRQNPTRIRFETLNSVALTCKI